MWYAVFQVLHQLPPSLIPPSPFHNTSGVSVLVEECPAWWLQQRECPVLVGFRTRDFKFNTLSSHPCKDRNLVGRECSGVGVGV